MSTSSGDLKKQPQIHGKSRLRKYVLAPFRGLAWMRDLYVKKITRCADGSQYAGMGYPAPAMSRTQSVRSTADDDLRELIRAVSRRDYGHLDPDVASGAVAIGTVPRSQSVAVGRIDEDKPVDFDDNVKLGPLFPRSRSAAPMRRKREVL